MMYYSFEPSTWNATTKTFANLGQSSYGYGGATATGTACYNDNIVYKVGSSSVKNKSSTAGYLILPDYSLSSPNITVSFWINRAARGIYNEWPWICNGGGKWVGFQFYSGSSNLTNISGNIYGSIPIDNKWYHIAMVCSSTQTNKTVVYINGISSYTTTTNQVSSGVTYSINSLVGFYGNDCINGNIDDFRMYSRDLSPAEITSIYNYRG